MSPWPFASLIREIYWHRAPFKFSLTFCFSLADWFLILGKGPQRLFEGAANFWLQYLVSVSPLSCYLRCDRPSRVLPKHCPKSSSRVARALWLYLRKVYIGNGFGHVVLPYEKFEWERALLGASVALPNGFLDGLDGLLLGRLLFGFGLWRQ